MLQAPQLRAVDNAKATLKIGRSEPTASGSFQPGIGGVGINPLVNTQFKFIDVGVNVEILPRVHDNGDVSMHVDLDISNIAGQVNLGGINQPIIGQRKIAHDIRLHEGEVSLLGGLIQYAGRQNGHRHSRPCQHPDSGALFTGESVDHNRDEIMIALIPHVIRKPEITAENLRGIAVGNATSIKLSYAQTKPDEAAAPKAGRGPEPRASAPAASCGRWARFRGPGLRPHRRRTDAPGDRTAGDGSASDCTTAGATGDGATGNRTAGNRTAHRGEVPPAGTARVRFSPAQVDTSVSSSITVALTLEKAKMSPGPLWRSISILKSCG